MKNDFFYVKGVPSDRLATQGLFLYILKYDYKSGPN